MTCLEMSHRLKVIKPSSTLHSVVAAWLILLVLALTFASVSPELHASLHFEADSSHSCEGHSHEAPADDDVDHRCAVTLFDRGEVSVMPVIEVPQRADVVLSVVANVVETTWSGQAPIRLCSRAPPIESLV